MVMKKISIVVPMYNEEEVAKICYKRIKENIYKLANFEYEFIFINDGSKDNTLNILKEIAKTDNRVKVISFSRNFGHQSALSAGFKEVSGDVCLIIDADLQDPPELIPDMLELWEDGNDIIYGKRKSRKGESAFKLFSAKVYYKTLNALSEVSIPKDTGDFRLVDRKVIDIINNMPEHNKFFRGLFSFVGFKQKEYEYERQKRYLGKTKYSLKKMLNLASNGIIGFSNKPLKLSLYVGTLSLVASILFVIYYVLAYILKFESLSFEWATIMIVLTFLCGILLISIYILSEYISRIYDEVKGRPEYIIDEKINIE